MQMSTNSIRKVALSVSHQSAQHSRDVTLACNFGRLGWAPLAVSILLNVLKKEQFNTDIIYTNIAKMRK